MYHALIRTHHITSRKKVAALNAAAKKHGCATLLRSGGIPGIMYVRGDEGSVREWVDFVHVGLMLLSASLLVLRMLKGFSTSLLACSCSFRYAFSLMKKSNSGSGP